MYRYDPAASADGLLGDEGTFSLCSFLYVEALARAGRVHEAVSVERMSPVMYALPAPSTPRTPLSVVRGSCPAGPR